jgi:cytochrome b561
MGDVRTSAADPDGQESPVPARALIAAVVIIVTIVALTLLGAIAIMNDKANALPLFNILLLVMASVRSRALKRVETRATDRGTLTVTTERVVFIGAAPRGLDPLQSP